jgi:hypothetical protein
MSIPPIDQWDGKPLTRLWTYPSMRPGQTPLKTKPARCIPGMPEKYASLAWYGDYKGYGRDEIGQPLFRSLKNALRFARAAWNAGYRAPQHVPLKTLNQ